MTRFHFSNTKDPDMRYLVGQTISDPFFYLEHDGKRTIWLSALDIGAFKSGDLEAEPLEPLIETARARADNVVCGIGATILAQASIEEKIHISRHFPLDLYQYLIEAGFDLTVSNAFVPERIVKTTFEIEEVHEAQQATVSAMQLVVSTLEAAEVRDHKLIFEGAVLTSELLKERVHQHLFAKGFVNTEGLVISSGPESALPHHEGVGPLRPHTPIICDIFPQQRERGYFGDMTRTFVKGGAPPELTKMYDTVAAAQRAAFATLKAGVPAKTPYEASAQVIQKAGYTVGPNKDNEGYIHSLGHGVGLEVHEAPSLSPRSAEILEAGMVVTIEPGLYYHDHGGVRLEDTVVITEDGYTNLTEYPNHLVIK